jgi:hypothetical protein
VSAIALLVVLLIVLGAFVVLGVVITKWLFLAALAVGLVLLIGFAARRI